VSKRPYFETLSVPSLLAINNSGPFKKIKRNLKTRRVNGGGEFVSENAPVRPLHFLIVFYTNLYRLLEKLPIYVKCCTAYFEWNIIDKLLRFENIEISHSESEFHF
jgi:hypothetical protein